MAHSIFPRRSLLTAIAMLFSFGLAQAGPGATKAKNKLAGQIQKLVSNPELKGSLSGEAVVFFTVDEDHNILVKGVFGTNAALIQHIEESLKGKQIDPKGLEAGEEFQVKLKFNDLR